MGSEEERQSNVPRSFIFNIFKMEITQTAINSSLDKQIVEGQTVKHCSAVKGMNYRYLKQHGLISK